MGSHRKLTTYGRVSRRLIPNNQSIATDDVARYTNKDSWGEIQVESHETDYSPPEFSLHCLGGSPTDQPQQSNHSCLSISACGIVPKVSSRQIPADPHLEIVPTSVKKNLQLTSCDDDAICGITSSDCGACIGLSTAGLGNRKRRKLAPASILEPKNLVYDDESLQRHIAAEASNDRIQPLELDRRIEPKARSLKPGMQAFPPKVGYRRASRTLGEIKRRHEENHRSFPTTIYPPIGRYVSSIEEISRTKNKESGPSQGEESIDHVPQEDMCDNPDRYSRVSRERNLSATKLNPDTTPSLCGDNEGFINGVTIRGPPTPPRSSTGTKITTPRQRELWNRLLNDDREKSKSSVSDPPRGMIECPDATRSHEADPDTNPWNHASTQISAKITLSRNRIIDHLHGQESYDEHVTRSVSEVEADIDTNRISESPETDSALSKLDSGNIDSHNKVLRNHVYGTHENQSIPSHASGGLKVTYARQRSFLTEDDPSQVVTFDLPMGRDTVFRASGRRGGAGDVMPKLKVSKKMDECLDNEVSNSQGSIMRSIHELREAGGNARTFGEMEAMLDDIDEANSVSLTLKRSRLLDLAVKFDDLSFCRTFIDQNLDQRLFAHLESSNDLIVDTLFAAMILRLLASSASIPKLSHVHGPIMKDFLIKLLKKKEDLAISTRTRRLNLSKLAQADFRNLWDSLQKSAIWRGGRPLLLTPCVISLQCLEYLVRQAREVGGVGPLISKQDIMGVAKMLRLDALGSSQGSNNNSMVELHLSVSILESCTISNATSGDETPWIGKTLDITVGLLPLLDSWPKENIGTLRTLTLRLYLNLTNNNPMLCEAFSRPDVIGSMLNIIVSHFQCLSSNKEHQKSEVLLDTLILSLGSIINLVEWCDTVRPLVLSLRFKDACFLDILMQLFMSKKEKAAEVRSILIAAYHADSFRSFLRRRQFLMWLLATYQFFLATCVSMK